MVIWLWVNTKKIMKVAYTIICASVLFCLGCLLAIPVSYIESARNEGVTILSALSMMPLPGVAGDNRYRGRRSGHVEVISRHLFWRD